MTLGTTYLRQPVWRPTQEITTHADTPIDADVEFFCPPPAEIGQVTSAFSNLRQSQQPRPMPMRLALAVAIGVVPAALPFFLMPENLDPVRSGLAALLLAVGVLIGWFCLGFNHKCSYVGQDGVARYTCSGVRETISKAELLLFAQAAEVRTAQTRQFTNGVYTGTSYDFRWTGPAGQVLLRLKGTYRSKEGNPKPKDAFHFARAAEIAWSQFLLDRIVEQLKQYGFVQFNIKGSDFVRIGSGFIEFFFRGQATRVLAGEIASLNLNQGQFSIKHKDARWFSSKGKFNFPYGEMANARLFILCLDKLLGYRFGAPDAAGEQNTSAG